MSEFQKNDALERLVRGTTDRWVVRKSLSEGDTIYRAVAGSKEGHAALALDRRFGGWLDILSAGTLVPQRAIQRLEEEAGHAVYPISEYAGRSPWIGSAVHRVTRRGETLWRSDGLSPRSSLVATETRISGGAQFDRGLPVSHEFRSGDLFEFRGAAGGWVELFEIEEGSVLFIERNDYPQWTRPRPKSIVAADEIGEIAIHEARDVVGQRNDSPLVWKRHHRGGYRTIENMRTYCRRHRFVLIAGIGVIVPRSRLRAFRFQYDAMMIPAYEMNPWNLWRALPGSTHHYRVRRSDQILWESDQPHLRAAEAQREQLITGGRATAFRKPRFS